MIPDSRLRFREIVTTQRILLPLTLGAMTAISAGAQTVPSLPGAASMLGGLPNLSGMGLPNVAGVLGYCAKNKLLGSSGAASLVQGLGAKPGVKSSPDYKSGSLGNIIPGKGAPVSLNSLPAGLKTQACDMVLKQGAKFL